MRVLLIFQFDDFAASSPNDSSDLCLLALSSSFSISRATNVRFVYDEEA